MGPTLTGPAAPAGRAAPTAGRSVAGGAGSARIGRGSVDSRYAGAMLLHAFLHRVGAAGVFAPLRAGPALPRYDDVALLTATSVAFALGARVVEATKHLIRSQVGPLAGLAGCPSCAPCGRGWPSWPTGCDPLRLQPTWPGDAQRGRAAVGPVLRR